MTRKFVISTILACTLLFSVAFDSPVKAASANAQEQVMIEKVEQKLSELLKGKVNGQMFNSFQMYFKDCFPQVDRNVDVQVDKAPTTPNKQEPVEKPNNEQVEQPKQEQPEQEQPKQEQPVPTPTPESNQGEQNQATPPTQGGQEQPAPQAPTEQEKPVEQGQLSQFEQKVVELTNVERSKQGLAPLQADVELSKVARDKSKDMQTRNYFDHTSPTYGSPFDMMRSYGINYQSAGENIAKGQQSPQEVVTAWMNSQGHRENILSNNFTHIGVGFVEQGNYWTQMFIGK